MNEFVSLLVALAAMWLAIVGLTIMVGGRDAGVTVLLWPIRTGFWLVRRIVGGLLIALGNAIRGGGHGGGGRDRRRR